MLPQPRWLPEREEPWKEATLALTLLLLLLLTPLVRFQLGLQEAEESVNDGGIGRRTSLVRKGRGPHAAIGPSPCRLAATSGDDHARLRPTAVCSGP